MNRARRKSIKPILARGKIWTMTLKWIHTEEGKLLRMNRSIQVEGAFGKIKADIEFRRFLCRGTQNVLAESILLGIAHNVNKLHNKIQSGRCGTLSASTENSIGTAWKIL
jgi:hypothetical protein